MVQANVVRETRYQRDPGVGRDHALGLPGVQLPPVRPRLQKEDSHDTCSAPRCGT